MIKDPLGTILRAYSKLARLGFNYWGKDTNSIGGLVASLSFVSSKLNVKEDFVVLFGVQ